MKDHYRRLLGWAATFILGVLFWTAVAFAVSVLAAAGCGVG